MSRALRWWSAAALDAMASALAAGWNDWCREWGCRAGGVVVLGAGAGDWNDAPSAWHPLSVAEPAGGRAWIAADPPAGATLLHALFDACTTGTPEAPRVAAEVGARAWEDLLLNCARWLGASPTATPADTARPPAGDDRAWSGAVRARLAFEGDGAQPLWLHLSAGAASVLAVARGAPVKRSARPLPPVVPVAQAMASRRVKLGVRLADVQLTLGALESLRPGDVLALAHRLEEPLAVKAHESLVCHAHLGHRSGCRAVALVRPGLAP